MKKETIYFDDGSRKVYEVLDDNSVKEVNAVGNLLFLHESKTYKKRNEKAKRYEQIVTNTYTEDGYSLLTSHCIYKDEVKERFSVTDTVHIYNKDRIKAKKLIDEEIYSDFSLTKKTYRTHTEINFLSENFHQMKKEEDLLTGKTVITDIHCEGDTIITEKEEDGKIIKTSTNISNIFKKHNLI